MKPVITNEHLNFLNEAREAFTHNKHFKTYRNKDSTLIALRRELDPFSDDIEIYEIKSCVGRFANQVQRYEG